MLQFNATARISYFGDELATVLRHTSIAALKHQIPVIVFSVEDLTHSQGSLHPFSLAVDLDVANGKRSDLEKLYGWLRRYLPAGYDVVLEPNHVHVEFDTHRPDALASS